MINVTEKAKQELRTLLDEKVDWPGARFRLMDRGQGNLGLGIDLESAGDQAIECDGTKVLLVEPELASNLDEVTLDVDETPAGRELVISGTF
jgi:Fe-S cluster assembly iron-binding protein IscA